MLITTFKRERLKSSDFVLTNQLNFIRTKVKYLGLKIDLRSVTFKLNPNTTVVETDVLRTKITPLMERVEIIEVGQAMEE